MRGLPTHFVDLTVSLVSADGKSAEVTVDNVSLAVSRLERLAEFNLGSIEFVEI